MITRALEENGIVIITDALSDYMMKLAPSREEAPPRTARKGDRWRRQLLMEGKDNLR